MVSGGSVPGLPFQPAYTLYRTEPSALPVLIAVPHAGRAYPSDVLDDLRESKTASMRLEDRYVDRVAQGVARLTGADLLLAHAPRAMLDLNRAPDDVDWGMVERTADIGGDDKGLLPARGLLSPRARSGLGLIPRRLPGIGELWRRRHAPEEVRARIASIHEPYHAVLAQRLEMIRARWGAALLMDFHSMPPLAMRGGLGAPEIVIGDRFGASCHGSLIATTFAYLGQVGREASHNRPYAGGYVLDRHAAPRKGIHAIQIEIDRSRYLDSDLHEPGPGLPALVDDLTQLVRVLAGQVAELAGAQGNRPEDWPQAAQ